MTIHQHFAPEDAVLSAIAAHAEAQPAGLAATGIPGVRLFWAHAPGAASPLLYDRGIVVIFQGRKIGFLGDRRFVYDRDNYLALTMPVPFACATEASVREPLCGLFLDVSREDLAMILPLIEDEPSIQARRASSAVTPVPCDEPMRSASLRLLESLTDPVAKRLFGESLRREVILAALRGPMGGALAGLMERQSDDRPLDPAIDLMRTNLAAPHRIEDLGEACGMSVSAFHRAFRARTDQTPLQYLKRIRLHVARRMIAFENVQVSIAAHRVGYESASQFSREYKRLFREVPAAARHRAVVDPVAYADPYQDAVMA